MDCLHPQRIGARRIDDLIRFLSAKVLDRCPWTLYHVVEAYNGRLGGRNEKSATDPIHFEETLTFSVLCSCRLSQIGIQKMTGKPRGTLVE